jgi:hypothetical protein
MGFTIYCSPKKTTLRTFICNKTYILGGKFEMKANYENKGLIQLQHFIPVIAWFPQAFSLFRQG